MEFIKTEWQVKVDFNKVYVVGTAPVINKHADKYIEHAMISKAVEYIEKAEKTGECIILSEDPKGLGNIKNSMVCISFCLMFKSPEGASKYAYAINK